MKKIILALIALAFAFAISSCCNQSYCPKKKQCNDSEESSTYKAGEESPYRWDKRINRQVSQNERQHRRW
jgi:hypothetical protein